MLHRAPPWKTHSSRVAHKKGPKERNPPGNCRRISGLYNGNGTRGWHLGGGNSNRAAWQRSAPQAYLCLPLWWLREELECRVARTLQRCACEIWPHGLCLQTLQQGLLPDPEWVDGKSLCPSYCRIQRWKRWNEEHDRLCKPSWRIKHSDKRLTDNSQ